MSICDSCIHVDVCKYAGEVRRVYDYLENSVRPTAHDLIDPGTPIKAAVELNCERYEEKKEKKEEDVSSTRVVGFCVGCEHVYIPEDQFPCNDCTRINHQTIHDRYE